MKHMLDNPGWNALITNNSNLANGSGGVRYFNKEVSPFVGLKEHTGQNLEALYNMITHDSPVCLITPVEVTLPRQWNVAHLISGVQMVYKGIAKHIESAIELRPLSNEHIPQMMALTKLTNPGPFAERTIDFGHYMGVFNQDKLVAMAGQRLHPGNYAEISAVCTHPDFLGRGYARRLLLYHIKRIQAAGETPFLHVRDDNTRAIEVYRDLGFETRTPMYFYILTKGME